MNRIVLIVLCLILGLNCAKGQDITYARKQIIQLEEALSRYERINQDDWMYFSCDSCLNPGDSSYVITFLRKNLAITGDLPISTDPQNHVFENELESSLKKFQKRHGLTEDGILGTQSIDALNVPISKRLDQIRKNIERWKQFDEAMQEPYLLVNIPDYTLSIIDSGKVIQVIKVIVGRVTHPTPQFKDTLTHIVLNPSWNVPRSIATKEILPILQHDPSYLSRNHMEVYSLQKGSKINLNPDSINWADFSKDNFPYRLVQTPGSWNALGKIKFIFPNKYDVYFHDTQEKYLFAHRKRTYSHGCIRLEKPELLAAWLLKKDPKEIGKLYAKNRENSFLRLATPIAVSIEYFTCWMTEEGLQFREDIYQREELIYQPGF